VRSSLRDRAYLLQGEFTIKTAEQINLHVLAVITTLFMPASPIAVSSA
jgi:hypothetical protein